MNNEKPSIYDFFDEAVELYFSDTDKRKIRIMPNDINKPILSQIQEYASEIALEMNPSHEQMVFDFYEMLIKYRIIQARDSEIRKKMIPWISVFDYSVDVPENNSKEDYRTWNFKFYKKKFAKLTEGDFDKIVDFRNKVFHRGFNLQKYNTDAIIDILKKYGVELPPPKKKAGINKYSKFNNVKYKNNYYGNNNHKNIKHYNNNKKHN